MTEAIPIAATALIPMILLPAFGIEKSSELARYYINVRAKYILIRKLGELWESVFNSCWLMITNAIV